MTQSPADVAFAEGLAHLNAGDGDAAEARFKASLALAPDHQGALMTLSKLLVRLKRDGEAEELLTRLRAIAPAPDGLLMLAAVYEKNQRVVETEACLLEAISIAPKTANTLAAIASFYERQQIPEAAAPFWRDLMSVDPNRADAITHYAETVRTSDPGASVAALEKMLTRVSAPAGRLHILNILALYKEWYLREQNGLMPYHAETLDDLFFRFSKTAFDEFYRLATSSSPATPQALNQSGAALFVRGEFAQLEKLLADHAAIATGTIWGCTRFARSFFQILEQRTDANLFSHLPPVIEVIESEHSDKHAAYFSCDYGYFVAFALPMIRSLADVATGTALHVHIMDADAARGRTAAAACAGLPLALSMTREEVSARVTSDMSAARNYFHAIRLVRFYQHLMQFQRPLWLMDVDGLLNRAPDALFLRLESHDVALRARPGRFEPWNQFNASVLGVSPSASGQRYVRLVAAYIAHFDRLDAMAWGIDQLALYAVYMYLARSDAAPHLALLDNRAVDYDYTADGIVWCNSGGVKHRARAENLRAAAAHRSRRQPYDDRFQRYANAAAAPR